MRFFLKSPANHRMGNIGVHHCHCIGDNPVASIFECYILDAKCTIFDGAKWLCPLNTSPACVWIPIIRKSMMACVQQCGSFHCTLLMSQLIIDLVIGSCCLGISCHSLYPYRWCQSLDVVAIVRMVFDIWFDLDVTAGVYLHRCTHGINVLFQSQVSYPKTMVCVSAS